jgi:hypothetical protein
LEDELNEVKNILMDRAAPYAARVSEVKEGYIRQIGQLFTGRPERKEERSNGKSNWY